MKYIIDQMTGKPFYYNCPATLEDGSISVAKVTKGGTLVTVLNPSRISGPDFIKVLAFAEERGIN